MDWHSWLSTARLGPALAYEYALLFARNELEAEDAAYFDHEFLQSMGISVAKHRLEILKVARGSQSRSRSQPAPRPIARLLAAVGRTRRLVTRYVRSFVRPEETTAIVVVHRPPCDGRASSKRGKVLKRTSTAKAKRPAVMAIGGGAAVHAIKDKEKGGGGGGTDGTIRWECMFQDLKPN